MAHAYNPSYYGGRDQEDCSLKTTWENSSSDPILKKIYHKKRDGGLAQGVGPKFKPITTHTYPHTCTHKFPLDCLIMQNSLLVMNFLTFWKLKVFTSPFHLPSYFSQLKILGY
jgi:hypothetical protein